MDPHVKEPLAAYPLPPRVLPQHTWEDYAAWEGDWELIRGVPYSMSPAAKLRHHKVIWSLHPELRAALASNPEWCAMTEMDWIVDRHTTIRPDLMVAREPLGLDWLRHPPHMVLEVLSPSTATKDRVEKRAICEEQGVRYFLLVDPDTRVVEAFALEGKAYQPLDLSSGVLSLDFDGVRIQLDLARVWG